MRKIIIIIPVLLACVLVLYKLSTPPPPPPSGDETSNKDKPCNITIFIDLSDRIVNDGQPDQREKDMAIVGNITDWFREKTRNDQHGLQKSTNRIKVLFYPTPQNATMTQCADCLNLDVQKCPQGKGRRERVMGVKETFQKNLKQVYDEAIQANNFPGCDIWGFFTNGKVKDLCIEKGYRNVLFILTDGYILDEQTMVQEGDISNYISSKILNNPNATLKVGINGLDNLEVGIFEINPVNPNHLPKMKSMLEDWLVGMDVQKEDITIVETDLPATTKSYIDKILEPIK